MNSFRLITTSFATISLATLFASPAFAHASLESTQPADDSTASDVTVISLTAGEELLDLDAGKGFVIAVTDADGNYYGDGCLTVDGATASMPVALGAAGEYTVTYRVVSADGHPVEGDWKFTYAPAPDSVAGEAFAKLPVCGESQDPIAGPSPMPSLTATTEDGDNDSESAEDVDIVPWIGLATIPVIVGGIWLLIRSLGKRDSEDHLN
ncbi:MAG: hypothetical protein RLZ72_770 [Actinomycetota bacterium]|jgi:methionine-rich copper-binding protein CopC